MAKLQPLPLSEPISPEDANPSIGLHTPTSPLVILAAAEIQDRTVSLTPSFVEMIKYFNTTRPLSEDLEEIYSPLIQPLE
jgi:hypothetical protein